MEEMVPLEQLLRINFVSPLNSYKPNFKFVFMFAVSDDNSISPILLLAKCNFMLFNKSIHSHFMKLRILTISIVCTFVLYFCCYTL